jgi:hypothetical protein
MGYCFTLAPSLNAICTYRLPTPLFSRPLPCCLCWNTEMGVLWLFPLFSRPLLYCLCWNTEIGVLWRFPSFSRPLLYCLCWNTEMGVLWRLSIIFAALTLLPSLMGCCSGPVLLLRFPRMSRLLNSLPASSRGKTEPHSCGLFQLRVRLRYYPPRWFRPLQGSSRTSASHDLSRLPSAGHHGISDSAIDTEEASGSIAGRHNTCK